MKIVGILLVSSLALASAQPQGFFGGIRNFFGGQRPRGGRQNGGGGCRANRPNYSFGGRDYLV